MASSQKGLPWGKPRPGARLQPHTLAGPRTPQPTLGRSASALSSPSHLPGAQGLRHPRCLLEQVDTVSLRAVLVLAGPTPSPRTKPAHGNEAQGAMGRAQAFQVAKVVSRARVKSSHVPP